MTDPLKSLLFAGVATACAALAALYDLRERRIPNRLTAPAFVAALAAHALLGSWQGLAAALSAAAIGGFLFFLLYLAGGMGAGDVKLMAVSSAFVGMPYLGTLLVSTGIAGGIFAVVVALYRGILRRTMRNAFAVVAHHRAHGLTPHPEINLASPRGVRLPFALPIFIGCAITFVAEVWAR